MRFWLVYYTIRITERITERKFRRERAPLLPLRNVIIASLVVAILAATAGAVIAVWE